MTPGHNGFVLTPEERERTFKADPKSRAVIFDYLIGRELVSGDGRPTRYLIDFGERSLLQARAFSGAMQRVELTVMGDRVDKAELGKDAAGRARSHHAGFLDRWWRLSWDRADMKEAFASLAGRYVAGSRTQRWPFIFMFVSTAILPGDKIQTFAFDDDYSFGILQSSSHTQWYRAKAARLKNEVDYNYSTASIFDTFPWPQNPREADVEEVAKASRDLRRVRSENVLSTHGGMRGLYATLAKPGRNELRDAHAALDDTVLRSYGFSKKSPLLSQLLELNLAVATAENAGRKVLSPGLPPGISTKRVHSKDCVQSQRS